MNSCDVLKQTIEVEKIGRVWHVRPLEDT